MSLNREVDELLKSQLTDWPLAQNNYSGLKEVKTKILRLDGVEVLVQFNPQRIISSAARVDSKSIEARPCFLCGSNRPVQQRGIAFKSDYVILVNPFPIFPKHLTIPLEKHVNQEIKGHMEDMLDLAKALDEYVVFYNGPKCGASAPDHFHFQAGSKEFLSIEKDFRNRKYCQLINSKNGVDIYNWLPTYHRSILTLHGKNKQAVVAVFEEFFQQFQSLQSQETEPMLNILASFENENWIVHLFPRKLHRPSFYFETGEKKILLSPASVDLGGVLITPREEDFLKIRSSQVCDIFQQVCLEQQALLTLIA